MRRIQDKIFADASNISGAAQPTPPIRANGKTGNKWGRMPGPAPGCAANCRKGEFVVEILSDRSIASAPFRKKRTPA